VRVRIVHEHGNSGAAVNRMGENGAMAAAGDLDSLSK
jgi:hypothetical protein